jgi:hypothetical protein
MIDMMIVLKINPEDSGASKIIAIKDFLEFPHTVCEFGYFFDWLSVELFIDSDFCNHWDKYSSIGVSQVSFIAYWLLKLARK